MQLGIDEFRQLVAEALDQLPEEFHRLMKNVEVVVENEPSPEIQSQFEGLILGLYQGVPLHRRGWQGMHLPDKISIYQNNIQRVCSSAAEVRDQVRVTVMHEIGHHFGLDENKLRDLGY